MEQEVVLFTETKGRGEEMRSSASQTKQGESRFCENALCSCSSIMCDVAPCTSLSPWRQREHDHSDIISKDDVRGRAHEPCVEEMISFDQCSRAETFRSAGSKAETFRSAGSKAETFRSVGTLKTIAEKISIAKEWTTWGKCCAIETIIPILSKLLPSFFLPAERQDNLVNREIQIKTNNSDALTKRKQDQEDYARQNYVKRTRGPNANPFTLGVDVDQNFESSNHQIDILNSILETEFGPAHETSESSPPASSSEAQNDSDDAVALSTSGSNQYDSKPKLYETTDLIDLISGSMSSISSPSFGDTSSNSETITKSESQDKNNYDSFMGKDSLLSYDDVLTTQSELEFVGLSFDSIERSITSKRGISVLNDLCEDDMYDSESFDSLGNKKRKTPSMCPSGYEASDGSDTELSPGSSFSLKIGNGEDEYSLD